MRGNAWYKRYGSDFIAGTLGLSLEEKGAYSLVLDLIYDRGGPIPDDARYIAGVCGCSVRKWNTIRDKLISAEKLIVADGLISNFRAVKEIETTRKNAEERAESGRKGGVKTAEKRTDINKNSDLGQAELKHTRINQKLEVDKISSNEDNNERTKPPKRRNAYSAKFEEFWKAYPTDPLMSKIEASRAFERMQEEDQDLAISAIPAFRAHCQQHPDYRPVHAVRFLSGRRFDGFSASQKSVEAREFVEEGTEVWREIMKYRGVSTMNASDKNGKRGWWFDKSEISQAMSVAS